MVVLPYNVCHGHNGLCQLYRDYVTKIYSNSVVFFDGYETGPSTKDNTHLRRSRGKLGAEVHFKEAMFLQSQKDDFLADVVYKQQFIYLLSEKLQQAECTTVHATGDADPLTVQTAVECVENGTTIVIGEGTDLLVLLCMHADISQSDIILHSVTLKRQRKFLVKKVVVCFLLSMQLLVVTPLHGSLEDEKVWL